MTARLFRGRFMGIGLPIGEALYRALGVGRIGFIGAALARQSLELLKLAPRSFQSVFRGHGGNLLAADGSAAHARQAAPFTPGADTTRPGDVITRKGAAVRMCGSV